MRRYLNGALQLGRAGSVIPVLVLAACATSAGPFPGAGGDAVYMHPTTGDVRHCVSTVMGAALAEEFVGGVTAGNTYADCKTALDRLGYVRDQEYHDLASGNSAEGMRLMCRERVTRMTRDRADVEYWRCRAGQ